jgi:HPt (histidine-containing phosphotransfer) domain-containing protein
VAGAPPAGAVAAGAGRSADAWAWRSGPAVLDERTLNQIRELQRGVPNLLAKVAELYLQNSAVLLNELRACVAAKDAAGIAKAAHALKSTSFNTGAKDLAGLCTGLENIGLEGRLEDAKMALDRIIHEHSRVVLALESLKVAA